jgi:serine/threonine protein phosphatase PrpC
LSWPRLWRGALAHHPPGIPGPGPGQPELEPDFGEPGLVPDFSEPGLEPDFSSPGPDGPGDGAPENGAAGDGGNPGDGDPAAGPGRPAAGRRDMFWRSLARSLVITPGSFGPGHRLASGPGRSGIWAFPWDGAVMTRDHAEVDLGLLAGVTDRGLRHEHNEDAMEVAVAQGPEGPVPLAVVCDGVSTSARPADASQAAAQAAVDVLCHAAETGADLGEASAEAVRAAGAAVAGLAASAGSPSATYISAVVTREGITLCWLGDSRAYWLDSGENPAHEQLTTDDSLAQEMVRAGLLEESEALDSPHAHVVTRWVGATAAETSPHLATVTPAGPGVLLLCSDGMWNYQPEASELASLALPDAAGHPLAAAKALTDFALRAGGRDNITVVLIPFTPQRPAADG